MSWIVIAIVVLLAAFGPLLWFRPSARDKRLTALRARARAADLNVDIKALATLNPAPNERVSASGASREHSRLLALYSLILPRRLRYVSAFRLFRKPGPTEPPVTRGAVAVDDQWLFDPDCQYPPENGWPRVWEVLAPLAIDLPADVAAISLEPRELGVYWAEGAQHDESSVTQLAALLGQMATAVAQLDEALGRLEVDDDS